MQERSSENGLAYTGAGAGDEDDFFGGHFSESISVGHRPPLQSRYKTRGGRRLFLPAEIHDLEVACAAAAKEGGVAALELVELDIRGDFEGVAPNGEVAHHLLDDGLVGNDIDEFSHVVEG